MAVRLAELRGELREGFARLEGQLNVITQRSEQTREDVADLENRVSALESRRIPWALMASIATVSAACTAVISLVVQ